MRQHLHPEEKGTNTFLALWLLFPCRGSEGGGGGGQHYHRGESVVMAVLL